jgi:hypothetical protein
LELKDYFHAHLAYKADALSVTGDAAEDRYTNLSNARATVNAGNADVGTKRATRDAAAKTLRTRLRGLITELKQLLPGDDARWRAFGLIRRVRRARRMCRRVWKCCRVWRVISW